MTGEYANGGFMPGDRTELPVELGGCPVVDVDGMRHRRGGTVNLFEPPGALLPPNRYKPLREPSVIRIWHKFDDMLDYLVEHFDHGFTVPEKHPIVPLLWADQFHACALTVESTEEFMWKPKEVRHSYINGGVEVRCEPWIDGFRAATHPDWYFLELKRKGVL